MWKLVEWLISWNLQLDGDEAKVKEDLKIQAYLIRMESIAC